MGESEENGARLFSVVSSERQKEKESKGRKFHLKVKNYEGGQTLVCGQHREVVKSSSLRILKT